MTDKTPAPPEDDDAPPGFDWTGVLVSFVAFVLVALTIAAALGAVYFFTRGNLPPIALPFAQAAEPERNVGRHEYYRAMFDLCLDYVLRTGLPDQEAIDNCNTMVADFVEAGWYESESPDYGGPPERPAP